MWGVWVRGRGCGCVLVRGQEVEEEEEEEEECDQEDIPQRLTPDTSQSMSCMGGGLGQHS